MRYIDTTLSDPRLRSVKRNATEVLVRVIESKNRLMEKRTVYIAGKVTGLPYTEVYAKFKAKQLELEADGYEVVNPCEITPADAEWQAAMRICIKALVQCDSICLLPDWYLSDGAKVERSLALTLGLTTIE